MSNTKPPAPAAPNFIEFRGVQKGFAGKLVIRDLSLGVNRGEVFYIIGASGVGKSVTIKHLIGLLRVDAGEIWFDGQRIDGYTETQFESVRRRIGMVFQNSTLFDSMTLADNVALPLRKHGGLNTRAAHAQAVDLLRRVDMHEYAERFPAELSDGMRKRAAIARTLAGKPEVMLFDEPTTGLDPISARRIDALIRELARDMGVTALVVSHDLPSIFSTADRVAFLYQGRVYCIGAPAALRDDGDAIVKQFLSGASTGPMETPGF
ncbi:MAG: ATP-binding cassette domain-containing protein [Kofleriaceae bacterium]|nr:ATP-binding cassette domain-containing protein [Kofleriaceae bacterium]